MKQSRAREQGAPEEDGDGAGPEGWVDGAATDGRAGGVVRRGPGGSREGRTPDRPRERACTTLHDVVEMYHAYVSSLVARARVEPETERITQDVFLAMGELLQRGPMPDDVKAMLTRIAWNKINDELRDRFDWRERASGVDPDWLPASSRWSPETLAGWNEVMAVANEVVEQLEPVDGCLLRAAHVANNQEEAALAVGWPAPTFRRRLGEARARFCERLRQFQRRTRGNDR